MEPLDLTKAPPRAPRTPLAGLDLIMAGRTVDKMRATLPGGNLGAYQIAGFSSRLLEALGIGEDDFRDRVAAASSDADVANWLREKVTPEQISAFNTSISARRVEHRIDDADFIKKYPHVVNLKRDMALVDMLPLDDEIAFGVR
jgi:hypothetical protein